MWLDFGSGFKINRDNKNRITNIKVLNAESSKEEDFVTFAALLRYFLNKNNFDSILIEFTGFVNELKEMKIFDEKNNFEEKKFETLFTETYDLSLKTVIHDHKRYLEIETLEWYWYANSDVNKAEIEQHSINELKIKDYYNENFKDFYDKKLQLKFEKQKKQIPEYRAQIWLEALNKYHV